MSNSDGHLASPRRPVLPSVSSRTLHHPSFLPLYVAAGFAHHRRDVNNQTVHPITPAEFFYTDPGMSCGRRIPNIVSDLGGFDCLQLNTPPPVMSACLAPPTRLDPFRSGPLHPTRNLGSPRWRTNPIHSSRAVLQLTQEEDQAITNLLKLHHQNPGQSDETLTAAQMDFTNVAEPSVDLNPHLPAQEVFMPLCSDVQNPGKAGSGRGWSDMELEAADTLLSRFSLMEEDKTWSQSHQELAVTLPDPLPQQHNEDLAVSTETLQEPEALPALKPTNSTENDTGDIRFTGVSENGESGRRDSGSAEDRGHFSEVREQTLSDPEGDAVHVLLSLGDMGTLDILQ